MLAFALPSAATDLAVLPAVGDGMTTADLLAIDKALQVSLQELGRPLTPAADVQAQLSAAQELGLTCSGDDIECVLKVGTVAGFTRMLAVHATKVEGGAVLKLTVVVVDPPDVEATVQQTIVLGAGGPDVRGPMTALFNPTAYVGRVDVRGVPAGAEIFIDDELRAKAPLEGPIDGLKVGLRKIKVVAEGFTSLQTQVVIKFDQTASLELAMEGALTTSDEGSPAPMTDVSALPSIESEAEAGLPWAKIAVGSLGALIGAAGLTAALVAGSSALISENSVAGGELANPEHIVAWRTAQISWVVVAVALIVAGSGGALTGVVFVL